MSFFCEDTCVLKADEAIIGTVAYTWNDLDADLDDDVTYYYVHKDLPSKVIHACFGSGRLLPGYVIVEFMQPYDGHCLVAESSLQLVDRALAMGDVVKKNPTHSQSGTVISTSVICSLRPVCSEAGYVQRSQTQTKVNVPSNRPKGSRPRRSQRSRLISGFPQDLSNSESPILPLDSSQGPLLLRVPAQELTYWNNFRHGDHIIYHGWIGCIRSMTDEVTVRLNDGSLVAVDDPILLSEPYHIPGTISFELAQRLDRAGFYKHYLGAPETGSLHLHPANPCYPGQHVQTTKNNLRSGRWKFGAYDPKISPSGIVVGVDVVDLEIHWLSPLALDSDQAQQSEPPSFLYPKSLEKREIVTYDRTKIPKRPLAETILNASYGPDVGFGGRVRFRDPAGAAVKYGPSSKKPQIEEDLSGGSRKPSKTVDQGSNADLQDADSLFTRIPRATTQDFDTNVLQITSTETKALVRWQDCSLTEEYSSQLFPYLNVDEHDVWPGEKVSFKSHEEQLDKSHPDLIKARKVGVVQSVDAEQRIAHVIWFNHADIDMVGPDSAWRVSGNCGSIGDQTTEVSLYDIAAHPALGPNRGDLAIIKPDPGERIHQIDDMKGTITPDQSQIGEIIDLCCDGEVIVRLGASSDVRDVKLSVDRLLVVAFGDEDDDSDSSDDDYSEYSGSFSDLNSEGSVDPIDISIEYEGGDKVDTDQDEAMWTTDEEEYPKSKRDISSNTERSKHEDTKSYGSKAQEPPGSIKPLSHAQRSSERYVKFTTYPRMPAQFAVVEDPAPNDHHFLSTNRRLTAELMRRIGKERKIMESSLPDGVFVRTWENRLDLLRVLIVGPCDTPYEYAPFVIDFQLGSNFPNAPPDSFFHSWTGNSGRINPNLYEDGKICLSLLGTWAVDESHEGWSAKKSTLLQVIVSLMGLVLVKEPYYSESFLSLTVCLFLIV